MQIRTESQNIITHLSESNIMSKNCKSVLECFRLFITVEMVSKIVESTNILKNNSQMLNCKQTN